jgi:hypothetical protein
MVAMVTAGFSGKYQQANWTKAGTARVGGRDSVTMRGGLICQVLTSTTYVTSQLQGRTLGTVGITLVPHPITWKSLGTCRIRARRYGEREGGEVRPTVPKIRPKRTHHKHKQQQQCPKALSLQHHGRFARFIVRHVFFRTTHGTHKQSPEPSSMWGKKLH